MLRSGLRLWVVATGLVLSPSLPRVAAAISLDQAGDIRLGVRTYVNARVGTEGTHDGIIFDEGTPNAVAFSATFPHSDAGHLRQNRAFIEAELNHNLERLVKQGVGPLSLLNDLPFKIDDLAYHLTFRGEGESVYDWGGREYSTAVDFYKVRQALPPVSFNQINVDVAGTRSRLRQIATDRERLFQAYVEGNVGDLFVRFGRQILSWGETDGFQLLDHIDPLDSSFGGFLISLDERRVPLDMLLANYYLGHYGPLSEMHLEGFVAIDNKVGYYPGTPQGSPWSLPGLGFPSNVTKVYSLRPARNIGNARGGVQLKFNVLDATVGLAHYYTYFDVPGIQVSVNPVGGIAFAFDDGLPCPVDRTNPAAGDDPNNAHCGYPTHTVFSAPKVQVSGTSTTFALPKLYSVVRSEFAYFKNEPAFTQGQLDPFIFSRGMNSTGGRRLRDSINGVIGWDMNQWIRFLNPNQTFLFSTQFFYKHIQNAAGSQVLTANGKANPDREVLPVPLYLLPALGQPHLEPLFISQPQNQYLQTLFVSTSYWSGQVTPGFTVFYDWGGAFVYQPSVTLSRDPVRFVLEYSILDSHIYKGGSGVSLLKDRDNVQFRFEYVI